MKNRIESAAEFERFEGPVVMDVPYFGDVTIDKLVYFVCKVSKTEYLTDESLSILDNAIAEMKFKILSSHPYYEIIDSKSTAELLGISPQAVHKSRYLKKRTFNFIDPRDGNRKFIKKSVEKLNDAKLSGNKKGDGFYTLVESDNHSIKLSDTKTLLGR